MTPKPAAEAQQPGSQDGVSDDTDAPEAQPQELLNQLTTWFQHSLAAGGDLADLFLLELQLTLGDARRLLYIWLAILPILLLTWVSLGVLISWLVYDVFNSILSALATFTLLQILATAILLAMRIRYRRLLGFRRTKEHAKRLLKGIQGESPNTD